MRLAIASTTILFAMMAAQATGFSATSTADVNLFKRAPTNGAPLTKLEKKKVQALYKRIREEIRVTKLLLTINVIKLNQSKEIIQKLTDKCSGKTSYVCIIGSATIDAFKKELVEFENPIDMAMQDRERRLRMARDLQTATREKNYRYS
ncbi:hypothetical protein BASA50_010503 [Batrachochytrium salamandrivorans]|uniref:Inhibitor I9 domain-containing protein n=1 Tax=Batrachochytrium salamandrivorans TaxID=1357716 RepID=A0ABQ8EYF1_9FUNG|nr:hypothetical protein BASA50_010503 [Batrachochytrium salamandrivorans]